MIGIVIGLIIVGVAGAVSMNILDNPSEISQSEIDDNTDTLPEGRALTVEVSETMGIKQTP